MKKYCLKLCVVAGVVLFGSEPVSAAPYTLTNLGGATSLLMSSAGDVAGQKNSNAAPFLFQPGKGRSEAGTISYTPAQVNALGDIVGGTNVYVDNYTYYFFLTLKGQESSLLDTESSQFGLTSGVAINDAEQVGVAVSNKIMFFNKTTKIGEVAGSDTLIFEPSTYSPSFFMLANGDALIYALQLSTPVWARVTSGGTITTIDAAILPSSASILKIRSDSTVVYSKNGSLFTSDLATAPIKFILPSAAQKSFFQIIALNSNRQYLAQDTRVTQASIQNVASAPYVLQAGKKPVPLACVLPNSSRFLVNSAASISDNGEILAGTTESSNGGGGADAILTPTGDSNSSVNYCAKEAVKIVGSCARYFEGSSSRNQYFNLDGEGIPAGKSCSVKVTLKDSRGKALKGARVVTQSYGGSVVPRGATGSDGSVTFKFVVGEGYGTMNVIAPYNHARLRSDVATMYFTGE